MLQKLQMLESLVAVHHAVYARLTMGNRMLTLLIRDVIFRNERSMIHIREGNTFLPLISIKSIMDVVVFQDHLGKNLFLDDEL